MLRILGNAYAAGRLDGRAASVFVRSIIGRRVARCPSEIYLETSPHLRTLLTPIENEFSEVLVAHVVRHPVDYIRSYLGHGVFRGLKGLGGRLIPFGLLRPEHLESRPERFWHEMETTEALAWRWNKLNELIESQAAMLGPRYARFRFEDLFHGPNGVAPLASWAGIDTHALPAADTERVNRARHGLPDDAEFDSASAAAVVERLCGARADRYGYARPLWAPSSS